MKHTARWPHLVSTQVWDLLSSIVCQANHFQAYFRRCTSFAFLDLRIAAMTRNAYSKHGRPAWQSTIL